MQAASNSSSFISTEFPQPTSVGQFDQINMTSPSASTSSHPNQTPTAPHLQHPTYPSLHYPPANPTTGQYPNSNWMYQQEYQPQPELQQQSFPPHNNRQHMNGNSVNGSLPNGNPYARQDQYHHQYAPQQYHHNPYYHPGFPQMGGPGPATMQNGYPYQEGGYPRQHHQSQPSTSSFQPPFDIPPPQPSTQSTGSDGLDASHQSQQLPPPNDGAFSHPHQPPPQFQPEPYSQFPPYPPQPHFQSFYPPNHPYAYGGGIGYQQFPGAVYESHYPHDRPPPATKTLNPAAQGFTFIPSSRPDPFPQHHTQGQAQARQMNGSRTPKPTAVHSTQPVFASISRTPPPAVNGIQNGQNGTHYSAPVIVDGEKLKGIGGLRRGSQDSEHGLGFSQMNGHEEIEKKSEPTIQTEHLLAVESSGEISTFTASTSTPAMTSSPATSATPISVQTPKVEPEASLPTPLKEENMDFGGSSISGLTSPGGTSAPTDILSSTAPLKSTSSPSVKIHDLPIRLSSSRPQPDVNDGNLYAAHLSRQIPSKWDTEMIEGGSILKLSTKGKGKASTKKVVFAVGNGEELKPEGSLIFGEGTKDTFLEVAQIPSSVSDLPITPPKPAVVPPPPKAKPSSWAALLRDPSKKSAAPSETTSVGPSSVIASPSKSIISLPTEDDAGPTTPKSTAVSLPPSTVASTSGTRPAFNYAAAAAAGKALSPQEDMAKLLTDGLRGPIRGTVPVNVPRGLINTGNMCFANTILQVLVYCQPFTELFEELGKRLKADLARRTPLLEAMILFLREFSPAFASGTATPRSEINGPSPGASTPRSKSKDTRDSRREAFVPENVYDAMKENKRFDSMRRGFQEDAEEYLGFFINTLHEELLTLLSRVQTSKALPNGFGPNGHSNSDENQIRRPVSPDGGWLEVGKKQKTHVVRSTESRESAITRIFGGTIRSVLHTPGQKDSVTLEPYQPLQLDIQSPSTLTISDALKHLSEPETVPGVWSSTRNTTVDATKQVYIDSFPPVLILHLKRFVYDPMEQNVVKKSRPIGYGIELNMPTEVMAPGRRGLAVKYRLFGVVYHHGTSASGGHYTVSVARQDTKQWLHFDDDLVSTIPAEQVVVSKEEVESGRVGLVAGREKCAYLLFYQRVKA